jgi:chemotaxis protein methyltransferase CheR
VTPSDYEYLRKLLRDQSGLDLSADKQYLIESRLLPLARKGGLPDISDLVQKMKGGSIALITQVVEAMTPTRPSSSATRFRSSISAARSCRRC